MDRRGFLGALAILAITRKLPKPKTVYLPRTHYKHTSYTLQFLLDKKMIEDDYYQAMPEYMKTKRIYRI